MSWSGGRTGEPSASLPVARNFVDDETGSIWNILGQAVEGPLSGQKLNPVVHTNIFWFAIAAFRPDAMIYQGIG